MDPSQLEPIIQAVYAVLEPLGEEKRNQVVTWLAHEAEVRPIVQYCADDRYSWELGQPDPLAPENDPRTVFGMLEVEGYVVIFSFAEYEAPGGTAIQFFRDICFEPKQVCGPLTHNALFGELQAYLTGMDNDTPEVRRQTLGAATNGARA
jgi:hypothetical protein